MAVSKPFETAIFCHIGLYYNIAYQVATPKLIVA